MRCFTTTFYFK